MECWCSKPKKLLRHGGVTHHTVHTETISRTTLMKYLDQLGYEIEEVLAKIIPDRFALAFDGWDNGNNSNYCGVFVM